jgi:hypothetical protein
MIKKTLLPTNDLYIQFTEEELSAIGAGPGTKFGAKLNDDGSIELRPYVKVEVDTSDWPRELLERIIDISCNEDISINDVINNLLKEPLTKDIEVPLKEFISEKAAIDPNFTNNDTSICNSTVEKD